MKQRSVHRSGDKIKHIIHISSVSKLRYLRYTHAPVAQHPKTNNVGLTTGLTRARNRQINRIVWVSGRPGRDVQADTGCNDERLSASVIKIVLSDISSSVSHYSAATSLLLSDVWRHHHRQHISCRCGAGRLCTRRCLHRYTVRPHVQAISSPPVQPPSLGSHESSIRPATYANDCGTCGMVTGVVRFCVEGRLKESSRVSSRGGGMGEGYPAPSRLRVPGGAS